MKLEDAESLSSDERARRFKYAIAEYARTNRELMRQEADLFKSQENVKRLEREVLGHRAHIQGLLGSVAYLDFFESLYWQFAEHGWDNASK